jgi:hypothetical protein
MVVITAEGGIIPAIGDGVFISLSLSLLRDKCRRDDDLLLGFS